MHNLNNPQNCPTTYSACVMHPQSHKTTSHRASASTPEMGPRGNCTYKHTQRTHSAQVHGARFMPRCLNNRSSFDGRRRRQRQQRWSHSYFMYAYISYTYLYYICAYMLWETHISQVFTQNIKCCDHHHPPDIFARKRACLCARDKHKSACHQRGHRQNRTAEASGAGLSRRMSTRATIQRQRGGGCCCVLGPRVQHTLAYIGIYAILSYKFWGDICRRILEARTCVH